MTSSNAQDYHALSFDWMCTEGTWLPVWQEDIGIACKPRSWSPGLRVQSEGGWENGPEEGGIARASAARALAELCAAPELHGTISKTGAAQALAEHGAEAVGLLHPFRVAGTHVLVWQPLHGLQFSDFSSPKL